MSKQIPSCPDCGHSVIRLYIMGDHFEWWNANRQEWSVQKAEPEFTCDHCGNNDVKSTLVMRETTP